MKKIFATLAGLVSLLVAGTSAQAQYAVAPRNAAATPTYDLAKHQRYAMRTLLIWGAGSTLTGIPMAFSNDMATRQVGVQNMAWGAVDAGIAVFALRGLNRKISGLDGGFEPEAERKKFVKVLGINTQLDIAYIGVGAGLMASGNDKLYGHGVGVLTQGSFLFVFDAVNWQIARRNRPAVIIN